MKKIERVGSIIKILSDYPNRLFSLKEFCTLFGAAKSTVSEDVATARGIFASSGAGSIETVAGARGGLKYVPALSMEKKAALIDTLADRMSEGSRILGGGFLYTSDLMCDSHLMFRVAQVFAEKFHACEADYVVTIETKGIPVAFFVAHMLDLPLVIARRESRVSEGSTVSINYFSGSSDRIQKMSLAKRAVEPGRKAIIIDDFMRAGGSIKGIIDVLAEFDVSVAGKGVVIAALEPKKKVVEDVFPIIKLGRVDEERKTIEIIKPEDLHLD